MLIDRPGQFIYVIHAAALIAMVSMAPNALAQRGTQDVVVNPVYLADAPVAIETIERAMVMSAQGSYAEAARTLGELILEQGDRLTLGDGDVSIPVRRRVIAVLLSDQQLLSTYRRINSPKARRLLDDGQYQEAWRDYWLTPAGCEGSLNHAQVLIESARFSSGVRVLERLLEHPDATAYTKRAIGIASTAYRASPGGWSRGVLERWSVVGGEAVDELQAFDRPDDISVQVTSLRSSPLDLKDGGMRIDGIVPRPIASAKLTPEPTSGAISGVGDQPEGGKGLGLGRSGAVMQPKPWSMPVVFGDTLVTNDGVTISCFDRFTLRIRWRLTTTSADTEELDRTSVGVRARIARTVEDLSSVTISDDVVYVAAGLARTGGRTGDHRLLSIDLHSGAILHAMTLEQLDPSLVGSTIRGSVIVDGDTLIVAARKNLRRERLVTLALVGIDRNTFKHLWTREIGSAGSLPFQQIGQISHSGLLDDGVLYWTDMMGLVCAVETATGDILWARAMPTSDIYARYEREPWTVSTPIVRGEHVYILGVDGQRIDQFDKHTGQRITSARSMNSGQGLYLVETPDHIACVNRTTITMHSVERFGVNKPRLITPTGDGRSSIHGRVVSSGSKLLVPISKGISVVDASLVGIYELIELEQTGLVIALDGQLVIADENEVSSYLSWDIARQLLTDRINDIGDVHAAITLGDLAYRSEHHDEVLPAVDRAIEMLRGSKPVEQAEARGRLFAIILDMVGLPDDAARTESKRVSSVLRGKLLQRSGRVARSAGHVLAQQMTSGAWHRAMGETRDAVRVYHGVLHDTALSSGMWQGGGLAIRAEIEATRQLDDIVSEYGRDACAMFDGLAAADRDAITDSDSPADFEQLARNYPWAPTSPGVWAMAAERWMDNDNAPAAVRAAQSGFDSIERLGKHGTVVDQLTLDSLGSSLVGGLLGSQRHSDAARAATALSGGYPGIVIVVGGQAIDAGALSIGLSSGQPAPEIGSRFVVGVDDELTLLAGSPVKSPIRSEFETMVFFAPQLAQMRMVRFVDSEPEVLWTRRSPDVEPPTVVVQNEFQTILMWAPPSGDPMGGWIESVETISGKTRWKLDRVGDRLLEHSLREPDQAVQIEGQFTSPSEGVVHPDQMLSSCDGSVLVLIDRIGRGMGIDILTGGVLWNGDLPVNRVHDVDLASGVLGVVGMWYVDQNPETGAVLLRAPRVVSIDGRTGQTIQLLHAQTSTPRWVRVAPSGSLVVGTSQRVLSVSTRTGTLDWVIRNDGLFNTNAGWIVDDTLVVLDEFVNLWPIGLSDGNIPLSALDTTGRILDRGWVDVRAHGDQIAVAASGGMGVFGHDGVTIGLDPERSSWPYIGAAWASDRVVLVRRASTGEDSLMHIPLKILDQNSAMLSDSIELTLPSAIQRQPTVIQAANGVVVIGFGEVSVVLKTE